MNYILVDDMLYIDIASMHAKTIKEFLDIYIISKKYKHLLIQNKWLYIDERPAKREDELKGDKLVLRLYPLSDDDQGHYGELKVVYEDELCLIVYKPEGLLVHSDGNGEVTLTDIVKNYLYRSGIKALAHPLHRLDKETQGLIFFSKSALFEGYFDRELEYKRIKRNYIAVTKGIIKERLVIDLPLGKDRHDSKRQVVYQKGKEAKTIVTPITSGADYSVVKCELKTGRTHQIRVHLAQSGYPILNDDLYGIKSDLIKEMGLVANEMSFYQPLKEEFIEVCCDLPKDIEALI